MTKMLMKEVDATKFVDSCAKELKKIKELKPPEWATFAKTGMHRKFPPHQKDWWYVRAASVFRKIYLDGPVGVARLRTYYGGRKERGHKPEHFVKASGNVIRKILQQLESADLVEKNEEGRRGRVATEKADKLVRQIVAGVKK